MRLRKECIAGTRMYTGFSTRVNKAGKTRWRSWRTKKCAFLCKDKTPIQVKREVLQPLKSLRHGSVTLGPSLTAVLSRYQLF